MSTTRYPPLVEALREPARYPHHVDRVKVIETHISYVLLAGEYAYKIKKPVDLGFLDFRSLSQRRHFCEEELRLNRRTAPELYQAVVAITGAPQAPSLGGDGEPVEYAVRMRRFSQSHLLDAMARQGGLDAAMIDALADVVASLHGRIPAASTDLPWATPERIAAQAVANIEALRAGDLDAAARTSVAFLSDWTSAECRRLEGRFERRRLGGFVRECHGDLHLGNIAWLEGRPVPFDAIEFSEELRWVDVMSEIAFLVMDLLDHELPVLAWRCLNRYLECTGDYEGVEVLRFYLVYRALVRAKVAVIRARQSGEAAADADDCARHLRLAERLTRGSGGLLAIMHGLSGSGKTTVSQRLLEAIGALRLRSDVERKRQHGLDARARSDAAIGGGIYTAAANQRVYTTLDALARAMVRSGWPVIVDAAFLRRAERSRLRDTARELGVPFRIVSCEASQDTLEARIAQRRRTALDASEATVDVLHEQIRSREALDAGELALTIAVEGTDTGPPVAALRALLGRL